MVYRPPSNTPQMDTDLVTFIDSYCEGRDVYRMVDFNLASVRWSDDPPTATSARHTIFLECFTQLGLTQHVNHITYIPSGHTLDLVLSSNSDHLTDIATLAPLPGCGHVLIHF